MENAVGTRRYCLVPEYTAWHEDADGRFLFFHNANLSARSVGAEKDVGVGLYKEGVLHIACGVFGGKIEGGEVVVVVFNLLTLSHCESKAREYFYNLVEDVCNRVMASEAVIGTRKCDVEVVGF